MVDLKNRILCGTVLALFAVVSLTSKAGIVVYPEYDARIERDNAYEVRVSQGSEKRQLTVYNHCEKSMLETRTRGGDVNRRFCEFAFDGEPITVEITFCEDVKSYSVFPSRLGLKSDFKDGVLSVTLEKPANFGVRINDYDKTILSVFADEPEDAAKVPRKGDAGVLFVEGWMDPPGEDGVLSVEEPVKEVYIAPGAVLNARLLVKSKGAYVHGRGMLLDPMSDIFRFDQTKNTKRGFFRVNAPDVTVEDVKLVDARTFNFCCWARNATFRNVKALATMMCSDGITCGGSGLRVEGAWLYVGDNALVISGLKDSLLRDIAIGTSCNAIFPQGSNIGVEMENVDVFRADEGLIRNVYNGVLRRNTKWNEMNTGEARKEPGPQDLAHQRQGFFFRNLSAVDCVLFSHFFVGGNMGTLPKTFGFENVCVPFPTGKDNWRAIGGKDGVVVNILHDSAKWLDTTDYALSFTNFWMGGSRLDAIPAKSVKNSDRVAVAVVSTRDTAAIPAIADRHEVNWTCSRKRSMGASPCGENLLADRPSTRSAWQRCPSWLVKFDAMQVEDGERVYRLVQCEKGAGMQNAVTDAFLRRGNGTYRLSFEARAKCGAEVPLQVRFISNEKRVTEKFVIPNDGEWHRFDADVKLDFDLAVTELLSVFLCASAPCDELSFRKLSLVKQAEVVGIPDAPFEMPPIVVPQFAERDFSIADFGAKIGAKATEAFMAAMAACEKAGGGRVVVPEGKWLTGAVHFRNNCNLHLAEGATLEFTDDPADYLPVVHTSWEGVECLNYSPLLYGYGVTNVAITGKGTIAPRMDFWKTWFPRPPEHMKATEMLYHWCSTNAVMSARDLTAIKGSNVRPHLIQFNRCGNVLLDGFRIRESPFWTIHLYHSENCAVRDLDVYAHGHNNDGLDIEMTRNVLVENCRFDQGDDGIVLKAGRNQDAWRLNRPTENVVIRNCEIVTSHSLLGIGSELSGGIRNVWMHHCKQTFVKNLFSVKTNRRRGGFVRNIYFEDIEADNIMNAVVRIKTDRLFQWAQFPDYELRRTEIDGLHIHNIRANCADHAIDITGDAAAPVRNVELENIWLGACRKEFEQVENAVGVVKRDVRLGDLAPKPWVQQIDEVWHRKKSAK